MPANTTIASTIIVIGHELNMEIIAEGIETQGCYEYIKNLNYQYGQGYLFQKPVPLMNSTFSNASIESCPMTGQPWLPLSNEFSYP